MTRSPRMVDDAEQGSLVVAVPHPRAGEFDHLRPALVRYYDLEPGSRERMKLQDELVRGYLPVVERIAGRYRASGEPIEDLR